MIYLFSIICYILNMIFADKQTKIAKNLSNKKTFATGIPAAAIFAFQFL